MLHVKKKVLGSLEKCYSLATLQYQGKEHFLCAAEKVNPCYIFSLDGEKEDGRPVPRDAQVLFAE